MKIRILMALLFVLHVGCQKEEVKNTEASIVSMRFDFGEVSFEDREGVIKAPASVELEKLMPTIELSEGAVVYPPSKAMTDFTQPVDYTVTSEDGENVNYYTVSVWLPIVKFTVYDCTNWSIENPVPELVSNAKISIFQDESGEKELLEVLTTDDNGEAFLYGHGEMEYWYLAQKDEAVNLIDGYIVNGVFQNQEDIDNYAVQPQPSAIGDLKFMDADGDGRVNENDKVDYRRIWNLPENGIKAFTVYIAKP
ncbi:hypothetical protein [uncultured Sunxiuqinia sp.]|uniref:hypothetical protein n=1 Tax=uncultured Sunxiuqinia sp. TaxID=1573825 RepID=UPI00260EFAE0|nr:hypothetical protein [uncultured Sunxiuqinia sp.]